MLDRDYLVFLARMIMFPSLLGVYERWLNTIRLADDVVNDILKGLLKSWKLFSDIKVEFLKQEFSGRDDIDLYMREVSNIDVDGDFDFNRFWVGKFLSRLFFEKSRKVDDLDNVYSLVLMAYELDEVSRGSYIDISVWDFLDDFNKRIEKKTINRKLLKTGIRELDEQVKMVDGTVTLFIAPWKRYKSILLTNIGAMALAQGFNVFHAHYEGKRELWETRYDSCLTGIAKNRLYNLTDKEKECFSKVFNNLKNRGVNLYFMSAFPEATGYNEILNELKKLEKNGKFFDVIIVDYLNLMKPIRRFSDDWLEQGQLAWDLVKLSKLGYIVVSAVQSTKQSADRDLIRFSDLGRSVLIAQAVDNLIAINQSLIEREQGVIRLSPLSLRDGEITKSEIRVEMNLWKMRISKELDDYLDKLREF